MYWWILPSGNIIAGDRFPGHSMRSDTAAERPEVCATAPEASFVIRSFMRRPISDRDSVAERVQALIPPVARHPTNKAPAAQPTIS